MAQSDFSLAGVIVIYAQIIFYENNRFEMIAIDNYQYPFADFVEEIDTAYEISKEDADHHPVEECFLIVGLPDRVNIIEKIIRQNIKTAFEKLIENPDTPMVA